MNKRAAKKYVEENALTISQLKDSVSATRGRREMSTLNPQFTLDQILDIFDGMLSEHEDDLVIPIWRYSPKTNGDVKTGLAMGAQNIVRECM